MDTKRIAIILIIGALLAGLTISYITGLDRLGYEGQLNNEYFLPASDLFEIKGDLTIGQTFLAPLSGLHRIDVVLRTYGRKNTRDATFYLKESLDSPEIIYQETFNASEVRNNGWRSFEFSPVPDSAGKSFFFYFASPDSVQGDAITVGGGDSDYYTGGQAYLGPVPSNADLAFRTYYGLSPNEKLTILGQRLVESKPSVWAQGRLP